MTHRLDLHGRSETGATAAEYALIASLIAAVIVGAVATFGIGVDGLFSSIPAF